MLSDEDYRGAVEYLAGPKPVISEDYPLGHAYRGLPGIYGGSCFGLRTVGIRP